MAKARAKAATQVYQLKVTLKDIRPPIWRRLQVLDCSLDQLHLLLQLCMGWANYHLHDFTIGGTTYGEPDSEGYLEYEDEAEITLARIVAWGHKKFDYTYDFGDHWRHTVQVEKVLPAEAGVRYPRCLAGKRACPPEDCGGPWGYADFLEALADPAHERHVELREWIGGDFDPEAFDLAAVDAELRRQG